MVACHRPLFRANYPQSRGSDLLSYVESNYFHMPNQGSNRFVNSTLRDTLALTADIIGIIISCRLSESEDIIIYYL